MQNVEPSYPKSGLRSAFTLGLCRGLAVPAGGVQNPLAVEHRDPLPQRLWPIHTAFPAPEKKRKERRHDCAATRARQSDKWRFGGLKRSDRMVNGGIGKRAAQAE